MRVRLVSRPAMAIGFALTGLDVIRVDDAAAAARAVTGCADDPAVGIVLVEDALYRELRPDLLMQLERQALPIVAPMPEPRWDEKSDAEAYILEILRQAIGYRVRSR